MPQALVEGFDEAAMWPLHQSYAGIEPRGLADQRSGFVARAVVHDDALPGGITLTTDAGESIRDGFGGIERRQEDRRPYATRAVVHRGRTIVLR